MESVGVGDPLESRDGWNLDKRLLLFMADFNRIDLNCPTKRGSEKEPAENCKTNRRFSRFSDLVLLLLSICTFHMWIVLYYQYIYDYHLLKLNRLNQLEKATNDEALNYSRRRADECKAVLETIGAPHMNLSFAVEALYLPLSLTPVITYFATQIYYRYMNPFNIYFVRNIFDREKEARNCKSLVEQQMAVFLNSATNFEQYPHRKSSKTLKLPSNKSLIATRAPQRRLVTFTQQPTRKQSKTASTKRRVSCFQFSAQSQLQELQLNNYIWPINMSRKWMDRTTNLYFVSNISCSLYGLCIMAFFMFALYSQKSNSGNSRFSDWFVTFDLLLMLFASNVSTTFFTNVAVFSCVDQTLLMIELRKNIQKCIAENTRLFYKSVKLSRQLLEKENNLNLEEKTLVWSRIDSSRSEMNRNLLLMLMQYKISVAQLSPLLTTFNSVSFGATIIMFLYPALGRVHSPYLPSGISDDSRLYLMLLSVILIVPGLISLLPICYMLARGTYLFKSLSSLLAHTTSVESQSCGENLYDRHTVSILRREVSYPDKLVGSSATMSGRFVINFSSLIPILFWDGLIIVSMILETRTESNLNSFISDPFRLF